MSVNVLVSVARVFFLLKSRDHGGALPMNRNRGGDSCLGLLPFNETNVSRWRDTFAKPRVGNPSLKGLPTLPFANVKALFDTTHKMTKAAPTMSKRLWKILGEIYQVLST